MFVHTICKKISGGNTSDQNASLAAGLRLDPLREHSPYFIFRPQMHQKRLVAGLRPDPLGEQLSSPSSLAAVGALEGNTL